MDKSVEEKEKEYRDRRKEHIARRQSHGLSYRKLADEFGLSKSKLHRDMKKVDDNND